MTQRRIILGLAGPAGSGKTAVRKPLTHHYNLESAPMAHPLKCFLQTVYPLLTSNHLWGNKKEEDVQEYGMSARQMLQEIGTDVLRAYDQDIWVRPQEALFLSKPGQDFVIDDIRFENEAAMVRRLGGVMVHLVRPSLTPIDRSDHSSERGLDVKHGDHILFNGDEPLLDFQNYARKQFEERWFNAHG